MPANTHEPHETTPLNNSSSRESVVSTVLRVFGLGFLYIAISWGMIAFNKHLMHKDRFPFAVPLVMLHSAFSSIITLVLFFVKPSWFPALTDASSKVAVNKNLILTGALPIALLFSVQLILSNTAYLHSSTAFLQMMKEGNLVLVYSFSLMAALETFSWVKGKLLVCIIFATVITIHGELNFSWTGFVVQGSGQLFESSKIVLQALLLTNAGRKLDALSYVLLVMPLCFSILSVLFFLLTAVHPVSMLQTPAWSHIVTWWPVLVANASLAFALNLVIALFIKHASSVGFIMAGIAKDACIVTAGGLFLGEVVSRTQAVAFTLQLSLICVWSMVKLFPERFEHGLLFGLLDLRSSLHVKTQTPVSKERPVAREP